MSIRVHTEKLPFFFVSENGARRPLRNVTASVILLETFTIAAAVLTKQENYSHVCVARVLGFSKGAEETDHVERHLVAWLVDDLFGDVAEQVQVGMG